MKRTSWTFASGLLIIALSMLFVVNDFGMVRAEDSQINKTGGWTVEATIPLPGDPTRFDYQSLDGGSGLLYLAHLGDGHLVVFDTYSQKVVNDLQGFPEIHGVLAVPELGRVYATVSSKSRKEHGSLVVLDMKTSQVIAKILVGIHPDGLDYEPRTGRLFVSNEWGKSLSVIDVGMNRVVATIPLHGEAGNTKVDTVSHRIYTTVQTRNKLVRVDPYALHVDRIYRLPCHHPHGLVINDDDRVAYVACEKDDRLLAVDLNSRRVLSDGPTGDQPDVLSYDAFRGLLFVASESGVVSVYQKDGNGLKFVSSDFLGKYAHSIQVDPRTHRLYLPLQDEEGHPVLKILRWEKK